MFSTKKTVYFPLNNCSLSGSWGQANTLAPLIHSLACKWLVWNVSIVMVGISTTSTAFLSPAPTSTNPIFTCSFAISHGHTYIGAMTHATRIRPTSRPQPPFHSFRMHWPICSDKHRHAHRRPGAISTMEFPECALWRGKLCMAANKSEGWAQRNWPPHGKCNENGKILRADHSTAQSVEPDFCYMWTICESNKYIRIAYWRQLVHSIRRNPSNLSMFRKVAPRCIWNQSNYPKLIGNYLIAGELARLLSVPDRRA